MSGRTDSRIAFPIHNFVYNLDPELVEAEPVVDTLTGCDVASKVCSRNWAIKGANNGYEILYSFARDDLSEQVIADVKTFFFHFVIKYGDDPLDELF